MESKLYEECHEGGGFMAEQAMLKQDETVRTQIPTMKSLDAGKKEEKKAASLDAAMNQAAEVLTQQLEAMPAAKAEPVDFSKVKIEPLFEDLVDFDTFAKSDFRVV